MIFKRNIILLSFLVGLATILKGIFTQKFHCDRESQFCLTVSIPNVSFDPKETYALFRMEAPSTVGVIISQRIAKGYEVPIVTKHQHDIMLDPSSGIQGNKLVVLFRRPLSVNGSLITTDSTTYIWAIHDAERPDEDPNTMGIERHNALGTMTYLAGVKFNIENRHHVIGGALTFCFAVQLLIGAIHHHLYSPERKSIPWWTKVHWWFGRFVVILAFVQIPIGFNLFNVSKTYIGGYFIYSMVLIITYITLSIAFWRRRKSEIRNSGRSTVLYTGVRQDDGDFETYFNTSTRLSYTSPSLTPPPPTPPGPPEDPLPKPPPFINSPIENLPPPDKTGSSINFPWLYNDQPPRIIQYPYHTAEFKRILLANLLPLELQHKLCKWFVIRFLRRLLPETYFPDEFMLGASLAVQQICASLSSPSNREQLENMFTPRLYNRYITELDKLSTEKSTIKIKLSKIYNLNIRDIWLNTGASELYSDNNKNKNKDDGFIFEWMTIKLGVKQSSSKDENTNTSSSSTTFNEARLRTLKSVEEGIKFKVDVEVDADVDYILKTKDNVDLINDQSRRIGYEF
ncbi:10527_t:CDS:10 [Entrophospora sp. SA101]|nr:10527_t:CDS:10 [Entrophospora sp. SA101]CAJ0880288.1 2375_t:CDS:10 [Entrophospora sp. SA101]CAJ0880322.1 2378_t:CDS:10 [Entrophospora sp. SA101]